MCRVTEQKRATLGKMSRDPMVDAVGRKPVHALDVNANPREHARVHVVPRKVVLLLSLLTDCPDEPGLPLSLQWEDDEKIAAVERDMQFAIHGGAARLHIGDVKEMVVYSARKANLQRLTDNGMCAIAAANVGSLTSLLRSIRRLQMGNDSTSCVLKGN